MSDESGTSTVNSSKSVNKRGQVRPTKYKSKYSRKSADESVNMTGQDKEVTSQYKATDDVNGLAKIASSNCSIFEPESSAVAKEFVHLDKTRSQLFNAATLENHVLAEQCTLDNGHEFRNDINIELPLSMEAHEIIEDGENDDEGENQTIQEDTLLTSESDGNQHNEKINNEPMNAKYEQWDRNTLIEDLLSDLRCDQDNSCGLENEFVEDTSDDNLENENEEPVQPGHTMTTSTSVLLIWMFIITHSMTAAQVSDLLSLINLHLLVANPALKSLHHFKKYFGQMKSPVTKHFFCNYCFKGIQQDTKICPNTLCGKNTTTKKGKDFFIELNIEKQIENLFAKEEFRKNLTHRFTRVKKHKNNIEDVYDGLLYKRFSEEGEMLNKSYVNNISLIVNTDGVPIFKSSKTSIWPIFLMINELPFRLRKQMDNMLLCGLWFGQEKPMMNMFFDPLVKSLEKLERGINVQLDGENLIVKGLLLCLSCDIPARSAVLNMNQHNGESSCPKCLQTGVNTRTSAGGNIRTFPFDINNPSGPERTSSQVKENGILANQKHQTVNGIKGISFLMFTPKFDSVKSVGLDYMHMLCLGIIRLLTKLWFSTEHSSQDFSMYGFIDIVDSRIENIKPSHFITRTPRTIGEHIKFWKAAEFRSWFFYYSIPCIMDLLKPAYFYHYCALVEAIYLLCKSSISEDDIIRSERLLNYYVFMFPPLYDERYVTLNLHSLLHLPQTVRELGPLWGHSCFAFEGANGDLLKMFHGTMFIDLQIVNAVHVFQMIPLMSQRIEQNPLVSTFVKSLTKQSKSCDSNIYSLCGKAYTQEVSNYVRREICSYTECAIHSLSFYSRAVVRGIVYHSSDYVRVSMRNSYTIKYLDRNNTVSFGFVTFFAKHVAVNGQEVNFACISKLSKLDINLFSIHHEWDKTEHCVQENFLDISLPFIHLLSPSEFVDVIPLTNIIDLCICIDGEKFKIVCEEPNHHELNL